MKKSIALKWAELLESGEIKQTTERLERGDGCCCLGVLSLMGMIEGVCDYRDGGAFDGESTVLPKSVAAWAGIKTINGWYKTGRFLSNDNDDGKSFTKISQIIRKNYKNL